VSDMGPIIFVLWLVAVGECSDSLLGRSMLIRRRRDALMETMDKVEDSLRTMQEESSYSVQPIDAVLQDIEKAIGSKKSSPVHEKSIQSKGMRPRADIMRMESGLPLLKSEITTLWKLVLATVAKPVTSDAVACKELGQKSVIPELRTGVYYYALGTGKDNLKRTYCHETDFMPEKFYPRDCHSLYQWDINKGPARFVQWVTYNQTSRNIIPKGVFNVNPRGQDVFYLHDDPATSGAAQKGKGVPVECSFDIRDAGGAWTTILKRMVVGSQLDFNQPMEVYEDVMPVGIETWKDPLTTEYWMGLKNMHGLTMGEPQELRIVFTEYNLANKQPFVVRYSNFTVSSGRTGYVLGLGDFSSARGYENPRDALRANVGQPFSTWDKGQPLPRRPGNQLNTERGENCATTYRSGWWYSSCGSSNLNGDIRQSDRFGIVWGTLPQGAQSQPRNRRSFALGQVEMMIRPVRASSKG